MIHFDYQKKLEIIRTSGFMFEVHLTEHCNLNCKGCSHFSPLAHEEFMEIDVFEKDMARMAQLFGGNTIWRINLLGGEPLLHPQVNDFMKIAANCFPDIQIQLTTNGILLPSMNNAFWETCRATRTLIHISRYPVRVAFSALERKAQAEGVEIVVYPRHTAKIFRKDVYDLTGMQDARQSHSVCELFGYCCQLNRGKFYPCTISAYFHHLNRFFNLGIPLSSDNFVDIYNAQSKDEFIRLITAPVPCCNYCNMNARKWGVKWERSKRRLEEWTVGFDHEKQIK